MSRGIVQGSNVVLRGDSHDKQVKLLDDVVRYYGNKNLEPFQKISDQEIVGVATWLLSVRSFHKEGKQQRENCQEEKHKTLRHRHLLKADLHLLWNEFRVVGTLPASPPTYV